MSEKFVFTNIKSLKKNIKEINEKLFSMNEDDRNKILSDFSNIMRDEMKKRGIDEEFFERK